MGPSSWNVRSARLIVAGVALAAAVPYVWNGPVWDDHVLLPDLLSRDLVGLTSSWLRPVGEEGPASAYFRPVAMTWMAMLVHGGPVALHLGTAVLHAGSAVLLLSLLGSGSAALAAALVFSVHPLASEVLAWNAAAPDALAVHLGLWSAVAARRSAVLAFGLCVMAGLSKEVGLLVLPAFLLADPSTGSGPAARRRRVWGAAAAWGVVLLLRASFDVGRDWNIAGKASLVVPALTWTWASLVVPWPLCPVRDVRIAPGWVVPVGLLALAAGWLLVGRSRAGRAGMLLLSIAPVVALPPVLDGYLAAERYAYVALPGLALATGAILGRAAGHSPVGWRRVLGNGLGVGAVALALLAHLLQAPIWSSDVRLFEHAVRVQPGSSVAWHLLGVSYSRADLPDEAATAFQRALEAGHPLDEDGLLLLVALVRAGRPAEALRHAEQGPREGLTAEYLAWWARAAADAGDPGLARRLLGPLGAGGAWDGPPWVAAFAGELGLSQ